MWFVLWLTFVAVAIAGPLLYARWLRSSHTDPVEPLPDPRGRQRPPPDVIEQHDLLAARLRMLAVAAAIVAAGWLLIALLR